MLGPALGGGAAAGGAAAVASFLAAVLAAIYLCGICSCQEILRRNGRGRPGGEGQIGLPEFERIVRGNVGLMIKLQFLVSIRTMSGNADAIVKYRDVAKLLKDEAVKTGERETGQHLVCVPQPSCLSRGLCALVCLLRQAHLSMQLDDAPVETGRRVFTQLSSGGSAVCCAAEPGRRACVCAAAQRCLPRRQHVAHARLPLPSNDEKWVSMLGAVPSPNTQARRPHTLK
eukprot:COSAG01_NODE_6087_length_3860_cov_2.910420_3_plen_229_part_00